MESSRIQVEAEGKGKPHHSFNRLEFMSTMTALWTQSKPATSRSFTCTVANTCHCNVFLDIYVLGSAALSEADYRYVNVTCKFNFHDVKFTIEQVSSVYNTCCAFELLTVIQIINALQVKHHFRSQLLYVKNMHYIHLQI